MKKNISGFTLVELMVTISIIAIMAAIALPNMRDFINSSRITNRAEQIANLVRFAKTEAVRRNLPVIMCGTNIRSDGRPTGNCDNTRFNEGIRAFADANRDGQFNTRDGDVDLRTININGNGSQVLNVTPAVYEMNVSGAVQATADGINQYVFMPDGTFGRKTRADSLAGLQMSRNYVRFQVADAKAKPGNFHTRFVITNPNGKVTVCHESKKNEYEAPIVCTPS